MSIINNHYKHRHVILIQTQTYKTHTNTDLQYNNHTNTDL